MMHKKITVLLACGLLVSFSTASADQIVKPHTFTAGTPANADEVNANFDTVYGQVNKVGAAITVDTADNVGIGTVTPVGELHVTKPQVISAVTFTGTGTLDDIAVDATGYTGSGTTNYVVRVANDGPDPEVIQFSSDGGTTWSADTQMVASGLNIGNGVTIGFGVLVGHTFDDKWEWSVSQGFADGLIVSDGKVTVKDIAIENGAANGYVLTSDATGNAAWQPTAPDADNDPANEIQDISVVGTDLSISGGSTVSIADNDNDPNNEIQTINRTGTDVILSNGGGTVSIADNDNNIGNEYNTSVTMSGTTLNVNDGGGAKSMDLSEKLSIDDLSDAKFYGGSLFIGPGTGNNDDGTNNNNIGIGSYALNNNVTGDYSTAVGIWALNGNTTGYRNAALGSFSLQNNTTGFFNTAVGEASLQYNTTGNYNVGIGRAANLYNQTGSNNTAVGYMAGLGSSGNSKSGNVFLGYQAGLSENGSNKLYIDNSSTPDPLIYGDFANDALTINGNASIGTPVNTTRKLNVLGGTTDDYAGYFETNDTSSAWGLYGRADGATNQTYSYSHYGVQGYAAGARYNYGVWGEGTGTGSATNYGLYGTANGATSNFGVRGYVYDTSASYNYGVYGYAVGGSVNYAGYFYGNVFVTSDVSAASFTDRTPYPKDLETAYDAVLSMQRLPDGEYDENNKEQQLDHSKLHDFVRSPDGEYRDLSATVSAQNEVIKDLIKQNQEKDGQIADLLQRVTALEGR